MRGKRSQKLLSPSLAVVVASFALVVAALYCGQFRKRGVFPDEKAAGLELLARSYTNAGYFHFEGENLSSSPTRKYYLSVQQLEPQVERVLVERRLSPTNALLLPDLIQRLVEPPESRMVGESAVNVLRLNLALDEEFPR